MKIFSKKLFEILAEDKKCTFVFTPATMGQGKRKMRLLFFFETYPFKIVLFWSIVRITLKVY